MGFLKKLLNFSLQSAKPPRQSMILKRPSALLKPNDLKSKVILKKLKPPLKQKKPRVLESKSNCNNSSKKSTEDLPKKKKKLIMPEEMLQDLLNKFKLPWIMR